MKKLLIIPISILLLTACASVEAPTVQTPPVQPEEPKVTQEEPKIETPATPTDYFAIKEEKTKDGWIRLVNYEGTAGYKGKEVTLSGKVVEQQSYGEWKYYFCVSEEDFEILPEELVKKIQEKDFLRYYSLYFEGKDVTDNYKNKEITVMPKSIGILQEGNPHLQLSKLP
jgi:hypothetical protein